MLVLLSFQEYHGHSIKNLNWSPIFINIEESRVPEKVTYRPATFALKHGCSYQGNWKNQAQVTQTSN